MGGSVGRAHGCGDLTLAESGLCCGRAEGIECVGGWGAVLGKAAGCPEQAPVPFALTPPGDPGREPFRIHRDDAPAATCRWGRSGVEEVAEPCSSPAQQIVLFGWSMGAAIALQLADRPRHEGLIAGLVLDSPVLDWTEVIKTNCARSGLPSAAGYLAIPWLTIEPLARLAGLPGRIPLRAFDWTARAADLTTPTLILHGTQDDSAPIRLSQALRDARPDLVELETFDADHTLAWNSDPERWRSVVTAWLSAHLSP